MADSKNILRMENKTKCILKRFYLFIFREQGREGVRDGEKLQCESETLIGYFLYAPHLGAERATQACALTENGTSDPSLCGMMSNQLSRASQG